MPATATQGKQLSVNPSAQSLGPCEVSLLFFHSDPTSGELLIKNHTDSNTGTYVCEAKNAVGQDKCTYALRAYNREFIFSK